VGVAWASGGTSKGNKEFEKNADVNTIEKNLTNEAAYAHRTFNDKGIEGYFLDQLHKTQSPRQIFPSLNRSSSQVDNNWTNKMPLLRYSSLRKFYLPSISPPLSQSVPSD
jgi:hypothetical protein